MIQVSVSSILSGFTEASLTSSLEVWAIPRWSATDNWRFKSSSPSPFIFFLAGSNSSASSVFNKEKDASLSWKTEERLESSPFATSELHSFGEMLIVPGPELEECFCPAEVSSGSVEEVEAVGRRSDVDVDGCGSSKHV